MTTRRCDKNVWWQDDIWKHITYLVALMEKHGASHRHELGWLGYAKQPITSIQSLIMKYNNAV